MKRRATYQGGDVHEHTTAFLSQGCSATFGTCNRNSNVCGSECRLLGDHPFAHPEADALVVKELSQLTVGEREGIEEEIHGVGGDIIEETQEMITECLARMQKEIDLCRKKSAYEQALFLSPHYVHDREFRLLFLRAEKFEASAAARRFIKYFDAKLFFWGQDLLCRDCTWNDLSEDDRSAVNTGSIWFSDKQDQSGRTIVWLCQKLEKFTNYKNQVGFFDDRDNASVIRMLTLKSITYYN